MKKNKKILILALLTVVISCGGGGGGGGGGGNTSNPTPSIPTPTPSVDSSKDSNGNIKWNDTTRTYNAGNPNNKTSATTQTGAGVTVGVIDMGFNTTNITYATDMRDKFGSRLVKPSSYTGQTSNDNHGIIVAEIIGGNTSNGIAKNVTIAVSDASKEEVTENITLILQSVCIIFFIQKGQEYLISHME